MTYRLHALMAKSGKSGKVSERWPRTRFMERALLYLACTYLTLACATLRTPGEAARALPSTPTVVPSETFRGVPVGNISVVIVDRQTLDRARIDERLALVERRSDVHGSERELRVRAIDELVDEVLLREAAEQLHVSVPRAELERAKRNKMLELALTDTAWAAEIDKQGLTEDALMKQWRDAFLLAKVRQQVLGPIEVDEADERAAYVAFSRRGPFEVAVDALYLDTTDTKASTSLARSLVARARSGEDFCRLVARYGVDSPTKSLCGSQPASPPGAFIPLVAQALSNMRDGDISEPLAVRGKLTILRLRHRVVPSFDEVRGRMHDAALATLQERLYSVWIKEQRARARIEIR